MPDAVFGYDWSEVLGLAFVLVVLGLVLTAVYRTMDHPRLPVLHEEGRLPRLTWLGLLFYLLSIGPLVAFWYLTLLVTLVFATAEPVASEIAVMAVAVIVATRFLAHVSRPTAHEVGKVIPIAVLAVFILASVTPDADQIAVTVEQLDANADQIGVYITIALIAELVITATWYVLVMSRALVSRAWHDRMAHRFGHRPVRRARAELGQIARTGQTLAVASQSGDPQPADPSTSADAGQPAGPSPLRDVDLLPEQTGDDTDDGWQRDPGSGDRDDLRRFLDERPPHHGD